MRVLLTTDTVGGVWMFTRDLAAELLDRGHAVALVSFGRMPSADQALWCEHTQTTYPESFLYEPSALPLEWMKDNALAYSEAAPLLHSLIERFAPDIVHSSQFCFGCLPLPPHTAMVVTAHSDVLSWASVCRPGGLVASPWLTQYTALVEAGLAAADAVIAPTEWMLAALHENFALPSRTGVILNGRSLPPAEPVEPTLQAVSVGRLWDEAKNLALLTRITPPFPIYIAGEQQHEDSAAPQELGALLALGALDEHALHVLFRASSLYLIPSLYEPFGLAPLEAALCGCALISNDLPSLREIWGDAALYFRGEANLVALLEALKASPDRLARARERAHQRALELTRARMADAYLALYADLLCEPATLPQAPEAALAHVL